jgi:hypothetical protein
MTDTVEKQSALRRRSKPQESDDASVQICANLDYDGFLSRVKIIRNEEQFELAREQADTKLVCVGLEAKTLLIGVGDGVNSNTDGLVY